MTDAVSEPLLLLGDCLDRLREMDDCSVDSVVTDPPYGLSFMGKKWDYDVPSEEIWRECLRVLKPGGHLLAFAGTRTQHRMAVRIEDAGFEIRDMIAWVYSTGFPKSHNFGCKCSKDTLPYSHEENLPREPKAERDLHPLRDSNVSPSLHIGEGRGKVLQPRLSKSSTPIEGREQLSATEVWSGESSMEGRCNLLEEEGQLQANQVCQVSKGVLTDGEERRIHHGTPFNNGEDIETLFIEDRSRTSCKPQPAGQPTGKSGVIPKQRGAQEGGVETDQVCAKCGKLAEWQGWGTALKPALEPITVARKPLGEKTVAANVLKHGTGAMNVDGCRVGTDVRYNAPAGNAKHPDTATGPANKNGFGMRPDADGSVAVGRWPANLIHDGSEEVLAGFPDGAPAKAGRTAKRGGSNWHGRDGLGTPDAIGTWPADQGGNAARFFYCPKTSKKDRDEGLDSIKLVMLELHSCESNSTQQDQSVTLLVDMETSLLKATEEFGTNLKNGNEWSTTLFGSRFMEQFQKECKSTTSTETRLTIESKILNALQHSITSDCTLVANSEMESGGSHAANVESLNTLTFTINAKMALALGVSNVQSTTQLKISVKNGRNVHSTVKPTELMQYLCRLVTPPDGIVLDPFMGSGSTGKVAVLEGFQFIGIERDEEYMKIAESRIAAAVKSVVAESA